MRRLLSRLLMRLVDGLNLGEYVTLDCRDGVHEGCDTCSCPCHVAA